MTASYTTDSTMYCLQGVMANGRYVHEGAVASNWHPLGTRLIVNGRRYVVEDRIGWGTHLDIWTSSCYRARAYGRVRVRVVVGWSRPMRARLVRRPSAVRVHLPKKWRLW